MTLPDYPIDLCADRPERSSRGWAALTILFIKFIALIPHFIVLFFLDIAQRLVAFVAQVVVIFRESIRPECSTSSRGSCAGRRV
jgi:hypothetical protein